ncbi:MAG: flagellar protein FlgN [Candidatus Marinimicrobia bacterium]|nr:flagellar protein FlgN [Candidatus Neomarinimicrobiota bacterium]
MAEKNIDAILQRLIRILSQEIVTYTKLLTSLEEKQQAIIQGEIENMKIITEQEQVILTDAKLTEKERNISIANLRTNTDEMKDVENLTQLIAVVETKYHSRLSEIQKSLKDILEKVALKNEQNKFLLSHSIHFVQTMIKDLLTSNESMNDLYAQNGRKINPKYLALLDRKI